MKKALFLSVLIAASIIFAGCNKSNTTSGSSANSSTSGSSKVQLTFFETMTSPARTQVIQGFINEFEASHPNITVQLISPPYEQADNRLTLMLNSNENLDIIEVRDHTVKQYVNNKKLTDLTKYIDGWSEKNDLMGLTMDAAKTVDKTPFLIPQFFYIKGMFVRTDIIEKLGVGIPKTMDELYASSIAITGKTPGQYGYDFRGKSSAFKISDSMLLANVGNVNPENVYESMDGKFSLDNAAGREALAKYIDLFKKAVPSDGINWGFNEQINAFISGTTPFLLQDPDTLGSFEGQLDPSLYTVVPVPVGTSGKRYLDYGFAGLSIPTNSKHPDEAWEFLKFMLSAKKNAEFCKSYGALPIHQTTFDNDAYFSSGVYSAWAETMSSPDTVFVKYPLDSPLYPGWSQAQEQTMQAALMGAADVDSTIKAWATYWGY